MHSPTQSGRRVHRVWVGERRGGGGEGGEFLQVTSMV